MSRLLLGLISGLVFGALVVLTMIPHEFPDKRAAMLGAFLNRLAIGVVLGAVIGSPQIAQLAKPAWEVGLAVGLLLSAPDAIILPRARVPIMVIGAVGGTVIGWIVGRFGI
jgi:hypothetical protein